MAELSDKVLTGLDIKELNRLLRGLPHDEAYKLRQRRRTLKNRGYSRNSRTKRLRQREDLEDERQQLNGELYSICKENDDLRRERDEARRKYDSLQKVLTNRTKQMGLDKSTTSGELDDLIDVVGIEEAERPVKIKRNALDSAKQKKRDQENNEERSDESR